MCKSAKKEPAVGDKVWLVIAKQDSSKNSSFWVKLKVRRVVVTGKSMDSVTVDYQGELQTLRRCGEDIDPQHTHMGKHTLAAALGWPVSIVAFASKRKVLAGLAAYRKEAEAHQKKLVRQIKHVNTVAGRLK